jgi:hypothetical protein
MRLSRRKSIKVKSKLIIDEYNQEVEEIWVVVLVLPFQRQLLQLRDFGGDRLRAQCGPS